MRTFSARLQHLVDDVLARLGTMPSIHSAFALAEWLATLLWKNHSGIYRLDELETTLLAEIPRPSLPPSDLGQDLDQETHLATEVYRSGGHSPLMAHLIRHADRPTKVLLTRMQDLDTAATVLGVSVDQIHCVGHETAPVAKVHALVRLLIRSNRVIVSIHPNDVLAAVALRMAKQLRSDLQIGFVNHADHVYSAGIGAADKVFEISAYGWGLRQARQTEAQSSFMGIPIQPRASNHREALHRGAPAFLSGGSPYKFRPLPGMSLPPVLSRLLAEHPSATLTVLGPKGRDWWWWSLRARHGRRVRVQQATPKERYQQLLSTCTVYIDSHPILGGTALPEALMSGCHVAGIRGVAWGYSLADELLSPDPDAFLAACAELVQQDAEALTRQQEIRSKCKELHDPAAVRSRLNAALSGQRVPLPFDEPHVTTDHVRLLESHWERNARLLHPGKNECLLAHKDKQWLARRHLRHFGPFSWSTLKLLFYAFVRA
jgi:hypothetical protein